MRNALALLAVLPLALAGCGQNTSQSDEPVTADAGGTAAPAATPSVPGAPTSSSPSPSPSPTDTVGIPEFGIPVALQGRWGMVPADCTSKRGDAKGLLGISATTLTFYESFGKLGTIKSRTDLGISADFTFSGEGMNWTREETMTVQDGGKTLIRTERGGEEPGSGGPFTYTRCAA